MKKTHHESAVRKPIMLGAALALLLGLPFAFTNRAFANPTPKFAYVPNLGDKTVSAYRIDSSTGALRPVAGSPFAARKTPVSVAVDPLGRFAYVVDQCSGCSRGGEVSAYTINSSTGALRQIAGSPFVLGHAAANSVAVDPFGQFVYVAGGYSVAAWTISSSTGALRAVPGSPFTTGVGQASSVTVDPSGQFAYVTTTSGVWAYTINNSTGALRAVAGSPFASGRYPYSVAVDPSGRFAYVANLFDNTVSAYTINGATGALHSVAGSPFATGTYPFCVAMDPSGQFVYVANTVDNTVSGYIINSSTGALRAMSGSPFATGQEPVAVAVDPSGQFAYATNSSDNTVSAYSINSSTGALMEVSGSPFAAGIGPYSVAIAAPAPTSSVITLTPHSLAFGNLSINNSSAAQSVTVTNNSANTVAITGIALRGTAPGQFSFTSNCGKSLAAYRTCTIEAKFRPTTKGAKTAFLDVNGGGGGRSAKLTGTGT